jgi:V8-like Glu-specific endopeptidase
LTVVAAAAVGSGVASADQTLKLAPLRASDVERTHLELGGVAATSDTEVVWYPDASWIKVHFQRFEVAEGVSVTVSDPAGTVKHHYPDPASASFGRAEFWALLVPGDTAMVEMTGPAEGVERSRAVIDMFGWGYPDSWLLPPPTETICGLDDRRDVACYEQSHPTEFDRSAAVAKVSVTTPSGGWVCTGWRLGAGPHLMTNEHCITSQTELDGADFLFNFQRTECGSGPSQPITIVGGDTLLIDNFGRDFALVTIDDPAAVAQFGYLELDVRIPVLGEEIYIPGHGDGLVKRLALESDFNPGGLCVIDDAIRDGNLPNSDTGYYCDSTGGQSGSPVLARSSHKVVALHHFGLAPGVPCGGQNMNAGVRIDQIWPIIEPFLGPLFSDGFESGDLSAWSTFVP